MQLPKAFSLEPLLLLMIEILHHLMYKDSYIHFLFMYYTTRNPILLVYKVHIRLRRISIINSRSPHWGVRGSLWE